MVLRDLGDSVNESIGKHKTLASIAIVVSGMLLLYKTTTLFSRVGDLHHGEDYTPSEEEQSHEQVPKPDGIERENVWFNDRFELTTLDYTPQNQGYKEMDRDKFLEKISRNCYELVFMRNGIMRKTKAVVLTEQLYMLNAHAIPNDCDEFMLRVQCGPNYGINPNFQQWVKRSDFKMFPERDLAFITIVAGPPHKNIVDLFCQPTLKGRHNGLYLSRGDEGVKTNYVVDIQKQLQYYHTDLPGTPDVWLGKPRNKTMDGECGALLITFTEVGPIIMGIHVSGTPSNSRALVVDRQFLKEIVEKEVEDEIQSLHPELSSETALREIEPELHKKSPARFIEDGTANVFGSFRGFRGRHKSHVEKTMMCDYLQSIQKLEVKYTKPVMNSWKPWRIAMMDMVHPVTKIKTDIMDKCKKAFLADILRKLPKEEIDKLEIYDDFTTINGAAGVAFVDKINRNTSMGNPWKKSKRYFLEACAPQGANLDPVMFKDEIMRRMRRIIYRYKCGYRNHPNFCAHLKDEAVSWSKAKRGKTRVFTGAPCDWSLVMRKYLLSFVRVMQRNKFIFEAAPGTVCQSIEWEQIYLYLTAFGTDVIAGDFARYDKSMPPICILAAFWIIREVMRRSPHIFSDDLRVIKGLAMDTAYPLIDFAGDLIEFLGSNPSGHPLTVIINSIVNSLLMRYVFAVLSPHGDPRLFTLYVRFMSYGDDNIMGVHKSIRSWFNHTAVAGAFAEVDIEYTMPDKEAESVPFIHIDDATFLKRRWRRDEDVGAMLCPLEEESIEKSLTVWVRSKSVSREHQAVDIIGSAVREYWFYGKVKFEEKRNMLMKMTNVLELTDWVNDSTFPTWNQLYDDFWNASKSVRTNPIGLDLPTGG